MIATLQLRTDNLAKIRRWKGIETDAKLAAAMGIDARNLCRVLKGSQQPGPKFIAALRHSLDAELDDLFVIVPSEAA